MVFLRHPRGCWEQTRRFCNCRHLICHLLSSLSRFRDRRVSVGPSGLQELMFLSPALRLRAQVTDPAVDLCGCQWLRIQKYVL